MTSMNRGKFIKTCCGGVIGVSLAGVLLSSCEGIHYAKSSLKGQKIAISRSELLTEKGKLRKFILIKSDQYAFPICLQVLKDEQFIAVLLECTHRSCELNVGGGIYTCPCHGSEFSKEGKVLEGPADRDLKKFNVSSDQEFIYVELV